MSKRKEAIQHAEYLAGMTSQPWVVYHSRRGGYRSYSVQNLSRLKRTRVANLPMGKIVHLARGRKRKATHRTTR